MNKTLLAVVVIVIILAGAYEVSRNASRTGTANTTSSPTSTLPGATASTSPTATTQGAVLISNFAFSPAKLSVKVGTKVTWTNNDAMGHTVTSDSGPASFDSGTIGQNQTFSFTFAQVGTYTYHCAFHPYMTGSVEVTQ